MKIELLHDLPKPLIDFVIVFCFSLLIGLEQRRHLEKMGGAVFGTDRTFAFLGILGFILTLLPSPFYFISGLLVVTSLLGIFYLSKLKADKGYGMTSILMALLVFSMPLVVVFQAHWMGLLLYVILLLLAEMKSFFINISEKLDKDEFFILSKFIIMAGLILPALPKENIGEWLPVSPFKIWLAVVVISGLSYISYLLKKYLFPKSGLLIAGVLGGLYSSTATTFVIARKSNENLSAPNQYAAAIVFATAMMYLRIYVLVLIFNMTLAILIWPYFLFLFVVSMLTAWWIYTRKDKSVVSDPDTIVEKQVIKPNLNPLDFKIALVFALLYVIFTFLTQITLHYYGVTGLTILSFVVGFTDIDPFLMNLFQGSQNVSLMILGSMTLQAMLSNNLLKMIYAMILTKGPVRKFVGIGFGTIIAASLVAIAAMYLFSRY
jgi:uncharacterized membrane protein (DUF4010 family)